MYHEGNVKVHTTNNAALLAEMDIMTFNFLLKVSGNEILGV